MLINNNLVFTSNKKKRDEILKEISLLVEEEKIGKSAKIALKDFKTREKQFTTGIGDGLAIPHCLSENIFDTKLIIVKLENEVDWKSLDNKPVNTVVAIVNPKEGGEKHLEILSKIAGKFGDPEFVKKITNMNTTEIVKLFNSFQ